MSRGLIKGIGTVATVVAGAALIGTGIGAALGGTMVLTGIASASTIATIAGAVGGLANMASQQMAKPPPMRGSVTQVTIAADAPQPYVMGTGLYAGVLRYQRSYGATLDKVPNPYRFKAIVYSGGGPAHAIEPRVEFEPVGSWYDGFLYTDVQLGTCPEADALAPEWAGAPGWGAASKLSGQPAIGWSLKFDKAGKRFASGEPNLAAEGDWVLVYDPRQDDTQPGGEGPCRLGDESTYVWDGPPGDAIPAGRNPALHAGTYAYGRYQNGNGPSLAGDPATGKRTMGIGLPPDAIDWAAVSAWANVCEANAWTMFGVVYEGVGPGEDERRWANLQDICFAGGGEPVPLGKLTFKYHAPVVPLGTVTAADLTEDRQGVVPMQSFRDRKNIGFPKYLSKAHNWQMVAAAPVVNATFLAEDGEENREVWPWNFVTGASQATQLTAYRIWESREIAPITLVCKAHMRHFRPGECISLDLMDELGLEGDAVILRRQFDPVSMKVTFVLMGETPAKHAYCLGLTGVAPPTPAIGQTAQERDELAAAAGDPAGLNTLKLSGSYTRGLAGNVTQVHDGVGTGTVTVTIPSHTRVYADGTEATITGGDITLDEATPYLLAYDDSTFTDGAINTDITVIPITPGVGGQTAGDAYFSAANPERHYLAAVATVDEAGGGGSTGGSSPPGGGGWGGDNPDYNVP